MTGVAAIASVHAHWSEAYGVASEFWGGDAVIVAPRSGDADYYALFVFVHGQACVVQAPPALTELAASLALGRSPVELLEPGFWLQQLGGRVERFVGPAWLGYADAVALPPHAERGARRLGEEDRAALEALEASVGPTAWSHAGIEPGSEATYGLYVDGALGAAGMVEVWGERLGHIGIVTSPTHQGQGLARAVVGAAMREGLASGLVMQYRTLVDNAPSMAIARRLGFDHYATTLAVRLGSEEPSPRQLGTLKGSVTSVAPDFDAIPPGFEDLPG